MKNNPSFLNWQGNNLEWHSWFPALFIGIQVLALIIIFLLKDKIYERFQKGGKFLFFKSDIIMWKTIGFIGLFFSLFRTILYASTGYPFYWSNFNLHICRIHVMIVFGFLALGKKEFIKYITYISSMGVFFGFLYGTEISSIVNNQSHLKDWDKAIKATANYKYRLLDELIYKDGFTFFNVGFDNWWLYDFVFAHLSIMIFPLVIRSAYGLKYTNKEFIRVHLVYVIGIFIIWTINYGTSKLSDPHWRMNNWYIGPKESNDNWDTLGWISHFPQNLPMFLILGLSGAAIWHVLWMLLDKIHFFKNNKFITIQKSRHWEACKKEGFKNIFRLRS